MMIELFITSTGKGYHPNSKWPRFDQHRHSFATKDEAMAWIDKNYGKAKREPMYIDTKDGQARKVGYVIGFRNSDISHYPVSKWIQRDWVEFRECKAIDV